MKIWVDIIGCVCAFGYAVVIPTFMLYLFYRQRVVLRSSRMIKEASATCDGGIKVFLHEVKGSTTERISRQDRGALACRLLLLYMAKSLNVCHGWMKKQVLEASFIFHFGHPAVAPG